MNKKYYVACRNIGMWGGITSPLKTDGKVKYYDTEDEARAKAKEMREKQGSINNFNSYIIEETYVSEDYDKERTDYSA